MRPTTKYGFYRCRLSRKTFEVRTLEIALRVLGVVVVPDADELIMPRKSHSISRWGYGPAIVAEERAPVLKELVSHGGRGGRGNTFDRE